MDVWKVFHQRLCENPQGQVSTRALPLPPTYKLQAGRVLFQGWPKDVAVLLLSCSTAEDPKTASCAPTTRVVEGGRSKDGLSQNGTTMLVFKPSSTKHWRHVTTTYMYFFDKSQLVHYPYHPPISCKQAGYFFKVGRRMSQFCYSAVPQLRTQKLQVVPPWHPTTARNFPPAAKRWSRTTSPRWYWYH